MAEPLVYQGTITLPTGVAAQGNIIVTPTNPLPVTASTSSPSAVQGNAASGAADSGNPVKIGGVYNSTLPTFTNGQRGDVQFNPKGSMNVGFGPGGAGDGINGSAIQSRAEDGSTGAPGVIPYGYNGATAARLRTISGAVAAGTGNLAVEEAGRTFSNIKTATTTTSKSGAGFLHSITINTFVASATITIYDNTAGSGTTIATITLPSTITSLGPLTLTYDIAFATGLTLVTSGATDITVAYR